MSEIRGKTVEVKCVCGCVFTARVADRKRGWAKSCSKSCAATRTNKKTGNYQRYCERKDYAIEHGDMSWDGIAGTYD